LSAIYDLFGNGRTALKTSWSKYYRNYDGDIAAGPYGKAGEQTDTRQWFDVDLTPGTNTPSGIAKATDRNGVAEDNEIGTTQRSNFGSPAPLSDRRPDPNLQRQYNDEFTAGIQHQVMPRLAVGSRSTSARLPKCGSKIGRPSRTAITLPST
jgi:hypothetical protein